ncbi:MAG: SMC-Scp complex subunit ScpB [Verrucomicrobiia bacterium]|jgi:segregation and condensation protein B
MNLKSIIEALLFAAHKPLSPQEIRSVLTSETEDKSGATAAPLKRVKEAEIAGAIEQLKVDYIQSERSFTVAEIAGGFQLVSLPDYGPWLKKLLDVDRPTRLSPSALETLAIIAYRQPITRVEMESVRGVNVDGVLRTLLERGLVKITGRSELPGRPLQYGTTQSFLEHFALRDLTDLPAIEELRRIEAKRQQDAAAQPAVEASQAVPATTSETAPASTETTP